MRWLVVLQSYSTYVSEDHVILGNAAILRCHIPSFVADTVHVDHWLIDENIISSTSDWGINFHPSPLPSVPCWWRGGERERDRKMATGSSLKASSSVIFFSIFWIMIVDIQLPVHTHSREPRVRHGRQQRICYSRQQRPHQMPIPFVHGWPPPSWIVDHWRRNRH